MFSQRKKGHQIPTMFSHIVDIGKRVVLPEIPDMANWDMHKTLCFLVIPDMAHWDMQKTKCFPEIPEIPDL